MKTYAQNVMGSRFRYERGSRTIASRSAAQNEDLPRTMAKFSGSQHRLNRISAISPNKLWSKRIILRGGALVFFQIPPVSFPFDYRQAKKKLLNVQFFR